MACAEITATDEIKAKIGPRGKDRVPTLHLFVRDKIVNKVFIGNCTDIKSFKFHDYFIVFIQYANYDSDTEYVYLFNQEGTIFEWFSISSFKDEGYSHDISIKNKNTFQFIYERHSKKVCKDNVFYFEIFLHEKPLKIKNFRLDINRYFKHKLFIFHNKFFPMQKTHYELKIVGYR